IERCRQSCRTNENFNAAAVRGKDDDESAEVSHQQPSCMCLRGFLRDVRVRAGLEQQGIMSLGTVVRAGSVCTVAAGTLGVAGPRAYALDQSVIGSPDEKRSPWAVFRLGFSAYQSGHKEQAVEAYRYAADNGQLGARWKLARMYAEGDG